MSKNTTSMRFDEDNFDLAEHKKKADQVAREKARIEKIRRQVKFGKIMLVIATTVIFFILFLVAVQLGWMDFR
ncbi:MAG: hypothetical protein FWF81_14330 [Defluviitaleaceae bacterium]|nr:hypothetical protein [Defluviitaleaceae bacterium]